jgi:hypothetical protein
MAWLLVELVLSERPSLKRPIIGLDLSYIQELQVMKHQHVTIPYMYGFEDEVSITFLNATFHMKDGLAKTYPDPVFGEWLITEIYSQIEIFADKQGVFKKHYICSSCGHGLDTEAKRPMQAEYELQFKDFPVFTMRIGLPAVICNNCQKICGIDPDGRVSLKLNDAIINAFKSENIKP